MPRMTSEARTEAILSALEAEDQSPQAERHSIPWKGGSERCTVIEIDLDVVLLNPQSHRIRAQLDSHDKAGSVREDPFGDQAQEILAELLRASRGFEDIKASLLEEGQRDPGVITRKGVLVNANTRAVALGDAGKKYLKVMVLPEGATTSQISELELRLQVREELKQEYSFTNELLFIQECRDTGWSIKRISKELGYSSSLGELRGSEQVEHQLRMLETIRELRQMSNGRLSYEFFDEMKQAMIDLDQAYQKLMKKDVAAAQRLRTARMVGILSRMYYRDLRNIDEEFVDSYLSPEIEDDDSLKPYLPEFRNVSKSKPRGHDLLGQNDGETDDLGAGLLDWLTETAGHKTVSVSVGQSKITEPRAEVVDALRGAMASATEAAKADRSRENLVERPVRRIKEARQKVQGARDALKKVRKDPALAAQLGALDYQVSKLQSDVESLVETIHGISSGEGDR